MPNSERQYDATVLEQVDFWNQWNKETRELGVSEVSVEQAETILTWMERLRSSNLNIIDVGCGTGWFCEKLVRFGRVTGTDLADKVVSRAAQRALSVEFVAGDFMALDFPSESYDVVTTLEVLSHVPDQRSFLSKIADMLKPNGYLMLATQNRPALVKNDISPPKPGQIRNWVDRHELSELLKDQFEIMEMLSITPKFNQGFLRYLNSSKLHTMLRKAQMSVLSDSIKNRQEQAWLGWSLMALAKKTAG